MTDGFDGPDLPPVIRGWLEQLLDPEFVAMVQAVAVDRIDVRFAASRGRVSRRPVVILNGGPAEFVE